MCAVMKLSFWVVFAMLASNIFVECNNETYEIMYDQQKVNVEEMIKNNSVHEKAFLGIEEAFYDTMANDGIFDSAERERFIEYLYGFDNFTKNRAYTGTEKEFADLMNDLNLFMVLSTPTIYEAMRFKEISDLGPLENIFSLVVEYGFNDAWSLIKSKTENGSCAAYDQLLIAVTDTPAEEYIKSVFNTSLCIQSKDTMAKWHEVFDEIDPDNRASLFIQEFSNYLPVYEFAKIAKAFRPTVYNQYFEVYANSYPVILALYNAIKSTAYTKEEKNVLRILAEDMRQNFPLLTNSDDRELFTAAKVAEIVSQNSSMLKTFSKIELMNYDGSFYDLIMWVTQNVTLEAAYTVNLHNLNISLKGLERFKLISLTKFVKPCSLCKRFVHYIVPLLEDHKTEVDFLVEAVCDLISAESGPVALLVYGACVYLAPEFANLIIDALAEHSSNGEICDFIHICKK